MSRLLVGVIVLCLTSVGGAQIPGVNTEFIGSLAKEMGGATTGQAEGAAGAIFGLAKSRLNPADFAKVNGAVPGMDGLLKAAPALGAASGAMGGLGSLAGSFSKLGLKPDMVAKAIPVVTNYVTKSGGAEVGKLLAGVLK